MNNLIEELTKGLNDYNSTLSSSIDAINKSLTTVGVLIISILLLMEFMTWYRYFKGQGATFTLSLFIEIAMKYVIAYYFVLASGMILDAILWFVNAITHLVGSDLNLDSVFEFEQLKKGNFFIRGAINILGIIVTAITLLSMTIIGLLRFFELYILKAIAPIMAGFYLNDETKTLSMGFLRRFGAVALQGTLIVIILVLWQATKISDIIKVSGGGLDTYASALSYIGKCVVFLLLIWKSQGLAKSLMQAN